MWRRCHQGSGVPKRCCQERPLDRETSGLKVTAASYFCYLPEGTIAIFDAFCTQSGPACCLVQSQMSLTLVCSLCASESSVRLFTDIRSRSLILELSLPIGFCGNRFGTCFQYAVPGFFQLLLLCGSCSNCVWCPGALICQHPGCVSPSCCPLLLISLGWFLLILSAHRCSTTPPNLLSSAKFINVLFTPSSRSLMKVLNKSRPNPDPYSTP